MKCITCGQASSKICKRCAKASYCCKVCQVQDWKFHKLTCKEHAAIIDDSKCPKATSEVDTRFNIDQLHFESWTGGDRINIRKAGKNIDTQEEPQPKIDNNKTDNKTDNNIDKTKPQQQNRQQNRQQHRQNKTVIRGRNLSLSYKS